MESTNALITIDQIVTSYLNERGISVTENYFRYKQIIIEGYTDLNIHNTLSVEEYIGKANEVNQMTLPPDLINWVSVSVNEGGSLRSLDYNNKLIIPKTNMYGTTISFPENFVPPTPKGNGYTKRRVNEHGQFNVNLDERIITFKGDFRNKDIYLMYISSGVSPNLVTYVSRELLPVLKAYLNWIITERSDRKPLSSKQRAEYLFGLELQKLDNFNNSMSAEELLAIVRGGYTQGVKQ